MSEIPNWIKGRHVTISIEGQRLIGHLGPSVVMTSNHSMSIYPSAQFTITDLISGVRMTGANMLDKDGNILEYRAVDEKGNLDISNLPDGYFETKLLMESRPKSPV